jgi:hypothetical protein
MKIDEMINRRALNKLINNADDMKLLNKRVEMDVVI